MATKRKIIETHSSSSSLWATSPMNRFLLLGALVGASLSISQASGTAAEDSDFEILGPDVEDLSWTPGLSPTAAEAELEEISESRRGYFSVPGVSKGLDDLYERRGELYESTGLRFGTAYTLLFQGLSGGPWDRFGGAGDFDFITSWTVGRETENTGRFVFDIENRHGIGARTPNVLGAGIATLVPTANTFNDRGWVVRDVFYEQRLVDGQLRLMLGRADSTDYFASTWMQSANNSFVNRMFASPSTIAAPGHGPATGISYRPNDADVYISAGAANAYGSTTKTGLGSLDEWTFFSYSELGWTPTFESLGEGRYTVSGWHMGERENIGLPTDWGLTAVADQQISEMVSVFGRYGYSEEATLSIRHYIQGGVGLAGLFGQVDDMMGVAFSYAFPGDRTAQDEKVFETFYRAQLTRFAEFSVGAQAILDPGNSPANDVVGAFWGRVRFVF